MKFTVFGVGSVAPAFSGCPANERQRSLLSERVVVRFGPDLSGQVITLWGLAFEPGTGDIRDPQLLASTGFKYVDIGRGAPSIEAGNDQLNAASLCALAA